MSERCINCGGDASRRAALPSSVVGGHDLRQCADCGFAFLLGPPGSLHDRPPGAGGEAIPARRDWLARIRLRPVLRTIARWHQGSPGRVLDVGCGLGDLIRLLDVCGWEVCGCDPADDARRVCGEEFGERFRPGDVSEAEFDDATFDVVVLNFSLEHVPRPRETMECVARLLRPGGVTVVRVPNFEAALQGRRGAVFQLRLPHHCSFFTASSLKRLLTDCGLETLETVTPFSLQEGMSVVCELFPLLDPERWMYSSSRFAGLPRASALAAATAAAQPWAWPRCRHGNGLVLHAVARRPHLS
jgi:SAM-dependent methyltransferase